MEIQSSGIFLGQKSLGESQHIAKVFSQEHGLVSGVIRNGGSRNRTVQFQMGDHVKLRWRARLEEQLGYSQIEHETSRFLYPLELDPIALQGLMSLCHLLQMSLTERVPEPYLYEITVKTLVNLSCENWVQGYLLWETALLEAMGFGMDIHHCAADCPETNLAYISPKSGRAVCQAHGLAYHDQLFAMPKCWQKNIPFDKGDIVDALRITGHFLSREIFPKGTIMPEFRRNMLENLFKRA